jgi:hypothetical protein
MATGTAFRAGIGPCTAGSWVGKIRAQQKSYSMHKNKERGQSLLQRSRSFQFENRITDQLHSFFTQLQFYPARKRSLLNFLIFKKFLIKSSAVDA